MEKKDIATEEWLDSQKPRTKKDYRSIWRQFAEFTGLTGDQVLSARRADKEFYWEKRVLDFKTWLIDTKKYAPYTATTRAQTIRGFFSYHRVPLQYRKQETRRLGAKERVTEDYRFNLDDFAKMFAVADLEEKYVLCAGKSFGLRAGDFLRLTRGDLEPFVNNEPPASIGPYKTQKEEGILAYPFIDSDAQPVIKLMLEKMTREGRTAQSEKIVKFSHKIQLSRVLKRLVENAGINHGNKTIRFHCLRKFLCDHLSSHMSESKWKQIVGKKISEGAYISPDELAKDYARAMPETCFTKRTSDDVQKIAKLEALKLFAKASGYTEDDIRKIRMRKRQDLQGEIDEIEALLAEKNRKDCTDGKNCGEEFKQVKEAELLGELKEGWQIAYKLENGELIIRRS